MPLTTAFDIVFAAGVGVAAIALVGAAVRFLTRTVLLALTCVELAASVAAWLAFAFRHDRELAVAAGGLTGCTLAAAGALLLAGALVRTDAIDAYPAEAQAPLRARVE